ncbi:MAG TPA: hypothetical protein VFF16_15720 [Telluria sp.]|nr:hypothetical protein [Telluria sp.]
MTIRCALLFALLGLCADGAHANPALPGTIVQLGATGHPMQYLLSLPEDWTPDRSWPIVLVEESAEKDFRKAMQRYVAARKRLPFILVMPYCVILGQAGQRDPAVYPYTPPSGTASIAKAPAHSSWKASRAS